MKYSLLFLFCTASLIAQESDKKSPSAGPVVSDKKSPSTNDKTNYPYSIDPKARASDIAQAFDHLRKDKPTLKVSIRTNSGAMLMNVTEVTASSNGTLLYVRYPSNQGSRLQVVPIEDVAEISYSP